MQTTLLIMQIMLAFFQICVFLWAFKTFLRKPTTTLEEKVMELEVTVKNIQASLLQGNDKFRENDKAIEAMMRSIIALTEFEIEYCLTEHKQPSRGLMDAKENLNAFLAGKRGGDGY